MTKRFDKAFRAEAVRLALSTGKSIAQTARELGPKVWKLLFAATYS